ICDGKRCAIGYATKPRLFRNGWYGVHRETERRLSILAVIFGSSEMAWWRKRTPTGNLFH
ncbi:uncharacterized protein METZ01_LOCUS324877, partial [marine metagenome]